MSTARWAYPIGTVLLMGFGVFLAWASPLLGVAFATFLACERTRDAVALRARLDRIERAIKSEGAPGDH